MYRFVEVNVWPFMDNASQMLCDDLLRNNMEDTGMYYDLSLFTHE